MYFSDRITLRAFTTTPDSYGELIKTPVDTEVWANKKSVKRAEFYAANTNGIDASIMFEVNTEDYSNQKAIVYNSKSYDVIRTFQKGEGTIELTCSDKAV